MKTNFPFDNSFAQLGSGFFSHQMPEPSPKPELIAYNDSLSTELGIDAGDDRAAIFGGAMIPDGAEPPSDQTSRAPRLSVSADHSLVTRSYRPHAVADLDRQHRLCGRE